MGEMATLKASCKRESLIDYGRCLVEEGIIEEEENQNQYSRLQQSITQYQQSVSKRGIGQISVSQ